MPISGLATLPRTLKACLGRKYALLVTKRTVFGGRGHQTNAGTRKSFYQMVDFGYTLHLTAL